MFRKFMLFGLGGFAIAAALMLSPGISTIAGHEPAFARISTDTIISFDLAGMVAKAVHEMEVRAALDEGTGIIGRTLNRAPSPKINSAALAPTSVSGWRSGRTRTLSMA